VSLQSAIVKISSTVSGHIIHLSLYFQGLGRCNVFINFNLGKDLFLIDKTHRIFSL
jgi:hypothetical protein